MWLRAVDTFPSSGMILSAMVNSAAYEDQRTWGSGKMLLTVAQKTSWLPCGSMLS